MTEKEKLNRLDVTIDDHKHNSKVEEDKCYVSNSMDFFVNFGISFTSACVFSHLFLFLNLNTFFLMAFMLILYNTAHYVFFLKKKIRNNKKLFELLNEKEILLVEMTKEKHKTLDVKKKMTDNSILKELRV